LKIRFSKGRIVETFSGYIVIILIPLSILIYQGMSSLKKRRAQIEADVVNQLRRVGEDFERDLLIQWQYFLEHEKNRKFHHYQPLIVPDQEIFSVTGKGLQRSPLYQTVFCLSRLSHDGATGLRLDGAPPTSNLSPSLDLILDNSLVGYFQLDPRSRTVSTPYDPTDIFDTDPGEATLVARYRDFLDRQLKPTLVSELDLQKMGEARPSNILVHLRTRRINKEMEPMDRFLTPHSPAIDRGPPPAPDLIQVSYYDFSFFTMTQDGEEYLVCFRPVVFEDRIFIQGFLFNALLLIQESQGYLEQYQPDHGNIVVSRERSEQWTAMFPPLHFLTLNFKPGDPDKFLRDYRGEMQRFWFILFFLALALVASLVHMSKLLAANVKLDRKKNDFISAITHELKAPLTSIIMYSEMLEEGWVKGKEITYYRYIRFESERLTRLINNILDFSGLERGVFRLKPNPLMLAGFVEDTLAPLKVWMETNNLALNLRTDADPYVNVDRDSLSQVIYNLIDNTIKYGLATVDPTLTIIVGETATEAVLIIHDNGPGVPKEDEEKVFKKFYRCENELTRESTGTGLGLALVKELIEGNGGRLSIYRPPVGSGFGVKITLPKMIPDAAADPATAAAYRRSVISG